jgi:pullulanase
MQPDLLRRKETHFVLWRPRETEPPPVLVIGTLRSGNPPSFDEHRRMTLRPTAGFSDLWEIPASECDLIDRNVYHYWFEVTDSNPHKSTHPRILCTDPTAGATDWRLLAPRLPAPFEEDDRDPAGVVGFVSGKLIACDPGGERAEWPRDPPMSELPVNNRVVIYELPTAWTRIEDTDGSITRGVGTFRDVRALFEPSAVPANFAGVAALEQGRAHLASLGINALELLPPADSFVDREWGYATSNYFAPDYELGFPRGHATPTPVSDLAALVQACHRNGVRFFTDVVMAFATRWSYETVNYLDFHVQKGTGDPEETNREDFGGRLFKYNFRVNAYDPLSGKRNDLVPARSIMQLHLARWMLDFRTDGVRMDSVVNFGNWDFIREFKDYGRALWRGRALAQGLTPEAADARFLVVAEELAVPIDLVLQNRVDALWNENFKRMIRAAILGRVDDKESSFEWTVRKLIDCRLLGFRDGAEAVNYVTSHDVEGFRNERLFNFLDNNEIWDKEPRLKLAFACLLTAVGIPMIFAGEEFGDQHDLPVVHPLKQIDPVNFSRMDEPWRRRVFDCVARLVQLRKTSDALAVNDTTFIHIDLDDGKRVLAWRRGRPNDDPVVVVANFSDFGTPNASSPSAEYKVNNWPPTPPGRRWREITQDRIVPPEWVGREPIFPWEAKVYACVT